MSYIQELVLTELPAHDRDPRSTVQAARLVLVEIGRYAEPDEACVGLQASEMADRPLVGVFNNEDMIGVGGFDITEAGGYVNADILELAVSDGHQGCGVGSSILGRMESMAAAAGAETIGAVSVSDAEGFYGKLGYEADGESGLFVKTL